MGKGIQWVGWTWKPVFGFEKSGHHPSAFLQYAATTTEWPSKARISVLPSLTALSIVLHPSASALGMADRAARAILDAHSQGRSRQISWWKQTAPSARNQSARVALSPSPRPANGSAPPRRERRTRGLAVVHAAPVAMRTIHHCRLVVEVGKLLEQLVGQPLDQRLGVTHLRSHRLDRSEWCLRLRISRRVRRPKHQGHSRHSEISSVGLLRRIPGIQRPSSFRS